MNLIHLMENASYKELDAARQEHLCASFRLVAGVQLRSFEKLKELLEPGNVRDAVIAIPVLLPARRGQVAEAKRILESFQPLPHFLGVHFVLYGGVGFAAQSLFDAEWVETLDAFYDQAVPTGFTVMHGGLGQVESFQLAATTSGLLRAIDSLHELRRVGEQVSALESRLQELEKAALRGGAR